MSLVKIASGFFVFLVASLLLYVLVSLNLRCRIFFPDGSTTRLNFAHGWPLSYQQGPIPGPGQLHSGGQGVVPNFIWGHPEFNDSPAIMQQYDAQLGALPRTPWALARYGQIRPFGTAVNIVVAVVALLLPLGLWVWVCRILP